MDEVQDKYNNFIVFIKGLDGLPITPQIQVFLSLPFNMFMNTIQKHSESKKTTAEICKLIYDKLDIDPKQFKDEEIQKFKRYVEYFNKVAKVM